MTNTELLKEKIKNSGYKLGFIASEIGMSTETLRRKINNVYCFDAVEISGIRSILNLSLKEVEEIFFASKVDKTSTR